MVTRLNNQGKRGTLHPFLIQLHTQLMAASTMAAWSALKGMTSPLFSGEAHAQDLLKTSYERANLFYKGVMRFHGATKAIAPMARASLWQSPWAHLHEDKPSTSPFHATCVWIPSLLNTSQIFHLDPTHGFAGYLRKKGIRNLFVDWQEPKGASLKDYAKAAGDALAYARHMTPGPLYVGGFCMGGLLALAGASLLDKPLSGTVLMATPWDFRQGAMPFTSSLLKQKALPLDQSHAPSWALQLPFHLLEPRTIQRKYQILGKSSHPVDPLFASLESWLCDLRPLSWSLVKECVTQFYQENKAFQTGDVMGVPLKKEAFHNVFMINPTQDRIVPFESSQALARLLGVTPLAPTMGHVGAFASKRAPHMIWDPLSNWFQRSSFK